MSSLPGSGSKGINSGPDASGGEPSADGAFRDRFLDWGSFPGVLSVSEPANWKEAWGGEAE